MERPMIKVAIEAEKDGATFTVAAHARTIEKALETVKTVYSADEAKVIFPLEPENFFVERRARVVRRTTEKSGAASSRLPVPDHRLSA